MATYKEIKGVTVQTKDEDPVQNVGAWSSGGNMNTARRRVLGSGIQTAAIAVAGYSTAAQALAEQYNGSSWTEVADLNTQRDSGGMSGLAPYTATIYFAGGNSPGGNTGASETWNGSSWTEVADLNTARNMAFGVGASSTAALGGGGETPPVVAVVEKYDGSSWTEVGDLNTARAFAAGTGSNTAAIVFGGEPPMLAVTEQWNGSAWTEVSDLNTARVGLAGSGSTYTEALAFGGGTPSVTAVTENFDGTSWTEVADLSTARGSGLAGVGTSELSLAAGGSTGSNSSATEEWAFPPVTQAKLKEGMLFLSSGSRLKGFGKAVPTGTFSSGGNLNSEHLDATAGGASQSSFMIIAGYPNLTIVEQYDGSSWTEVADVNTTRQLGGASAQAPAPTMLFFGGNPAPGRALTELYDGSSWTEVGDLNTPREYSGGGAGTSTAALCAGGYGSPAAYLTVTESWDGTSWTEVNDLNAGRYGGATGGSQASARCVAGAPPGTVGVLNEGWNGTSWTEQTENSDNSAGRAGFGDNKDFFMVASGNATASSEFWNGTSWTETADTAGSGQRINMGGGTTTAGIIGKCSGPTPQAKSTEEFNCDNGLLTISVS